MVKVEKKEKKKNTENIKCSEGVEQPELSNSAGGSKNW